MKRIRQHLGANYYLPVRELKQIPPNYPPLIEKIDWKEHFSNEKAPEMIDLGCGKGLFIESLAKIYQDKNILGIELRKPFVDKIVSKKKEFPNLSAIWYNIANGLHFIEDVTVEKVFFLFPDPWFKKKHFKRRVFNIDLLNEIYRILLPSGKLYIATDIYDVHLYHIEILNAFRKFTFIELNDNIQWDLPLTNKQKSCEEKGIKYYRIICQK